MVVPVQYYLALSVALFALGDRVLIRRNPCHLHVHRNDAHAVNLAFIGFADYF